MTDIIHSLHAEDIKVWFVKKGKSNKIIHKVSEILNVYLIVAHNIVLIFQT